MKIDIHTHTKKIKHGDPDTRNISVEKFSEIINSTNVKILAITNHNHFDYTQYKDFSEKVEETCQIWPGIEIDVLEAEHRAHLIVIVNPKNASSFEQRVKELIGAKAPEDFSASISDIVKKFDDLDSLYIAHYHSKKPFLLDEDIEKLLATVSNRKRVLKEASNSISAGIYIQHGHNSIFGSDVQDWSEYAKTSEKLPELRLPVESFEQFCLLLEKDDQAIKTTLDRKTKENIKIYPFGISDLVEITIYNDINIIFGSKGTGKTEILKALSKHYNQLGFSTKVYESNAQTLSDACDLKGASLTNTTVETFGIDSCSAEIENLRNATEKNVTSLSSFVNHYSAEETNKNAKNIKVNKLTSLEHITAHQDFKKTKKIFDIFKNFKKSFDDNTSDINSIIGNELSEKLNSILLETIQKFNMRVGEKLIDYNVIILFNSLIKTFASEISKKTGLPEKPLTTGFYNYARNRIVLERDIKKILLNISKKIAPLIDPIGELGEKGSLFRKTNISIQDGLLTDKKYAPLRKISKTPQKSFATKMKSISKNIYTTRLFEEIDDLKSIEGSESIDSINDLLLFHIHFTLKDAYYTPSTGESSMILLQNEFAEEKDIYLIDEPEKSLGNDYISEVIVPLIKQRARSGKKIIIATHDANIAVRTLPYNSIYRLHDADGYHTYYGNPFSDKLICDSNGKEDLIWKNISMKTLEGGLEAFGERGKIYGTA